MQMDVTAATAATAATADSGLRSIAVSTFFYPFKVSCRTTFASLEV